MKKIFYIIIFTVVFGSGSFAQNKTSLTSDFPEKILRFYPNPAVSFINFEYQKGYDRSYSFQLYNFIGKKVLDLQTTTPKINISLNDFYRGVYIYQLRNHSGKIIESGKFQVIK